MSLFGTNSTVESLLNEATDDTASLLEFITADIQAIRDELEHLEEIKEKLESIEKEERELYKDDLSEEELVKILNRLEVVGNLLNDAHEEGYDEQKNNPEENRAHDRVLKEVQELRRLYAR